jgi:hypothetical protein
MDDGSRQSPPWALNDLVTVNANTILMNSIGYVASVIDTQISSLTAEAAPVTGDVLLGEEAGGLIRKFDVQAIADLWNPTVTSQTECVMLDAAGINCKSIGGCTTADVVGTNFDYTVATFTDADGLGHWSFNLPDNLVGTTAAATVFWSSADAACNGGTDDVCFTLDGGSATESELWETMSLGGTQVAVTDNCHTDGDLLTVAFPAFTHDMTAGERAVVQIGRDTEGTDAECVTGDDDYTGNAQLLAVKFCYEVNNVFSGE